MPGRVKNRSHGGVACTTWRAEVFPVKDFAPIALVVLSPNVLTAHPSLPVQSLKDLIQLAKAKPGQLTYASPGIATASHMAGVLFTRGAGIDLLHVPYKGGGVAVNDVNQSLQSGPGYSGKQDCRVSRCDN